MDYLSYSDLKSDSRYSETLRRILRLLNSRLSSKVALRFLNSVSFTVSIFI